MSGGLAKPAPWHGSTRELVLSRLSTSLQGLTEAEARRRLAIHGPNELRGDDPIRPLAILLGQFKSWIVWVLIAAAVVSGSLREWADGIAILSIVLVNGLIGFRQEFRAERSLAALRRMTAPRARVRRGGRSIAIDAAEVVPGDLLELEAGDVVPADARILEACALRTVESSLTGESVPVDKKDAPLDGGPVPLADRRNMVFLGTSVAAGKGLAVAVETGMSTEMGRITGLLAGPARKDETPLEKRLRSIGRLLVGASLGIVGSIFVLGLLRGIAGFDLFLTSVSLAVAAVPEGLPAVVTIALAVGVQRMAARGTLVRKLHAVETLGSADVICTDKTGTLTVGEMTVRALWTAGKELAVSGEGYAPEGRILGGDESDEALRELLTIFAGCNDASLLREGTAWKVVGDPTEGALLAAAAKLDLGTAEIDRRLPRISEIPFDSDRKRMTVVRRLPSGARRALVKGAPDVLLERCTHLRVRDGVRRMTEDDRREILAENLSMGRRALRVLAAAARDLDPAEDATAAGSVESRLVFAGLAGMYDPPRPEAKRSVARAQRAGIRVVMITGDHPHTALAIARELGIAKAEHHVLSGSELDRMSAEDLERKVGRIAVYARATAAHKLSIVRAWKSRGGVVAMTGDGVNDAPAIRGADIGIAMGRAGTEVTKEASDLVVTDDDFASIVAAVEEGRAIYENIKKSVLFLLGCNSGELILMAVCVLLGLPLPLLPIQLLWMNLVTDGLPALCLATEPVHPALMDRRPRNPSERLTDRGFVVFMLATGLLTSGAAFAAYVFALSKGAEATARDHAFTAMVYAQLFWAFGARDPSRPLWRIGLFSNLKLALVLFASIAIQFSAPRVPWLGALLQVEPMPLGASFALLAVGAVPLVLLEVWKLVRPARAAATEA